MPYNRVATEDELEFFSGDDFFQPQDLNFVAQAATPVVPVAAAPAAAPVAAAPALTPTTVAPAFNPPAGWSKDWTQTTIRGEDIPEVTTGTYQLDPNFEELFRALGFQGPVSYQERTGEGDNIQDNLYLTPEAKQFVEQGGYQLVNRPGQGGQYFSVADPTGKLLVDPIFRKDPEDKAFGVAMALASAALGNVAPVGSAFLSTGMAADRGDVLGAVIGASGLMGLPGIGDISSKISDVVTSALPTEILGSTKIADIVSNAVKDITQQAVTSAVTGKDVDLGSAVVNSLLGQGLSGAASEIGVDPKTLVSGIRAVTGSATTSDIVNLAFSGLGKIADISRSSDIEAPPPPIVAAPVEAPVSAPVEPPVPEPVTQFVDTGEEDLDIAEVLPPAPKPTAGPQTIDELIELMSPEQPAPATAEELLGNLIQEDIPIQEMPLESVSSVMPETSLPEEFVSSVSPISVEELIESVSPAQEPRPISAAEREQFLEANIEDPLELLLARPTEDVDWASVYATPSVDPDTGQVVAQAPTAEELAQYPGLTSVQDFGTAPQSDINEVYNRIVNDMGGFASTWQTVGSDRVQVQDDGSAIGINTETGETYGLDPEETQRMVDAGLLNTDTSGYGEAIRGASPAPSPAPATAPAPAPSPSPAPAPAPKPSGPDYGALLAALMGALGNQQTKPEEYRVADVRRGVESGLGAIEGMYESQDDLLRILRG